MTERSSNFDGRFSFPIKCFQQNKILKKNACHDSFLIENNWCFLDTASLLKFVVFHTVHHFFLFKKKKSFLHFFYFHLVSSHHLLLYHIILWHIMSYHILSYNIISCHHILSSPLIKLHRTHRSCCNNDKASSTASWARSQSPVKWEKKKRNRKKSERVEKEKKMMRHERKREFIAKKIEHIS